MPSLNAFLRRAVITWLLLVALVPTVFAADGAAANPRQTWQLLDYIAVDYAGAVQDRRVIAPAEYAEMREFATTVRTQVAALFLFLLAFVAVYREVFETILFFIAMWSEQNSGAILGGLIAGNAALAVVAFWMLRINTRLPIAQFFSISSILIAVLAVVLVGKGIAALQEAGWVAQALVAVPRVEWLGIYPSWQSLLAQLGVVVAAMVGFAVNTRSSRALVRASKS